MGSPRKSQKPMSEVGRRPSLCAENLITFRCEQNLESRVDVKAGKWKPKQGLR